jgi:hypothetical protein
MSNTSRVATLEYCHFSFKHFICSVFRIQFRKTDSINNNNNNNNNNRDDDYDDKEEESHNYRATPRE